IFFGLDLSGLPTWGWTWNPYGSYTNLSEWKDFNITNLFTGYSGGVQTFYAQSSVSSSNPDWAVASVCCIHPNSPYQVANRPYVQITYSYLPSIPSISSPVAGSFSKSEIVLSANSSVVGGGTIHYYWEYSLDGATDWTSIFSGTVTSYTWNIPEVVLEDETIYVRCRAQHESAYSDYCAPVQFINGNEPAVAAKLAAEAAEAKAEEVRIALGDVTNRVSEIYNLLSIDTESPIITEFTYSIDKVRVVRNEIETFIVVAKDNITPADQLQYRYRINSGEYSSWTTLNNPFLPLNLEVSSGYKQILLEVQDLAANIAISRLGIFKY
ncbi:MAG: hypothetical protein CVU87_14105, partial [Firmicutes bacterium HGW-Firmicutes-12]